LGTTLLNQNRKYQLKNDVLIKLNKYTSPLELFAGLEMIVPIKEDSLPLTETPPIQLGMSLLELSIQNNTSPWGLQQLNDISGTWDVNPNEHLYFGKSEQEVTTTFALIKSVNVNSLPLIQGETVEMVVNTVEPAAINASINGKNLYFFSEEANTYVSLLGISAVAEPGAYQLQLDATSESGSTYSLNQWLLLSEGPYTNDPEIYVGAKYVDPIVISEEELIFDQLVAQASSTRYWNGRFQAPIADPTCIVGYFGNRRSYNDGALLYYHTGIDFNVCIEPNLYILAPARGIVVAAEEMIIRGNAIIIDHGWGVYTGYWHLSQFQVEVGDIVEPGQTIGIVGNTGRSAGPHLHFEMIVSGAAVNPLTWLNKTFPSQ
ncbi:MAG: M23 family metallopeptidase, partial [Anaerolineaceae bacterium]|nr:M23 family metallopeptidase [Anaerolineaceae bacterium]